MLDDPWVNAKFPGIVLCPSKTEFPSLSLVAISRYDNRNSHRFVRIPELYSDRHNPILPSEIRAGLTYFD
jgi:hypothetical protein